MKLKAVFLSITAVLCATVLFAQQNITLTTEDNWQLAATYHPSKNGKAVVLLHDLERSKADFASFESKLAEAGYGYIAIDMRGHGGSTNLGTVADFNKTGTDNEFNQMVRDVNSAVAYLASKDIPLSNVYLLGAGLGANVAAKSLIFNKDAAGLILLTPSLKTRDVLTMYGLKVYTNPVLIAVSVEDKKSLMEASFIRNAAFLGSGEGRVTFLTAYDRSGAEMLDKYLTYSVLQWLDTPSLPLVKPDAPADYDEPITIEGGDDVLPAPSVLQDGSQAADVSAAPQTESAQTAAQPTSARTVKTSGFDIL